MKIPANRLDRAFQKYSSEYETKALEVLRSGYYILGKELENFEKEFAAYNNNICCVGLASGLDALWIAFRLLGIGEGDEVLVQGNAYIACVMGITINGAKPVFVEPDEYYGIDVDKIEEKITKKTKAILAVHLYGMPCDMDKLIDICDKYGLYLVEDCAQAHGAEFSGKKVGTYGKIGCFSFYPSKNLGAFGDGGALVTDDKSIADQCRVFRNYGSDRKYYNSVVGANSRLDELQAGLLSVKLRHLEEYNDERRVLASNYSENIKNDLIELPVKRPDAKCVWHQFVIRCSERDRFIDYLREHEIGAAIHYPVPPHLSKAYEYLGLHKGNLPITEKYADTVVSLPFYNGMTEEEQEYVIDVINSFS